MSRLLGIDHGTRRIGLAVGDTETGLAFTRPAVRPRSEDDAIAGVAAVAMSENTDLLVIGLPRNMDGSEGRQAAAARAFGERLAAIGLSVVFHDERLTSWQAEADVKDSRRRPSRRSGELDSAAARILLQDYLDARREPGAATER
jgi:putative Holliday junction resolvase